MFFGAIIPRLLTAWMKWAWKLNWIWAAQCSPTSFFSGIICNIYQWSSFKLMQKKFAGISDDANFETTYKTVKYNPHNVIIPSTSCNCCLTCLLCLLKRIHGWIHVLYYRCMLLSYGHFFGKLIFILKQAFSVKLL